MLAGDLLGTRVQLTGPQSLTQAGQVTIIGEAIGRPLRYQEIPPEAARQVLARLNPPAGFIDALLAFEAAGVGAPAFVSPDIEKILGRPARAFARWAAEHAADFEPPR